MKTINKRDILIAAAVILIIVIIGIAVVTIKKNGNAPGSATGTSSLPTTVSSSPTSASSTTLLPVPSNVTVPDLGATSTNGVAVPQVESAAAPGVTAKYRSFNITVQNGAFSPSTVAVKVGDTVDLEITAVGGNYDFTQPDLGFNATLPDGVKKKVQFAPPTTGKFVFYCSSCGGPAKGPVGYIIVTDK
jgi:heme/copper-type cytochrome/quinol oxidase subunit 2